MAGGAASARSAEEEASASMAGGAISAGNVAVQATASTTRNKVNVLFAEAAEQLLMGYYQVPGAHTPLWLYFARGCKGGMAN